MFAQAEILPQTLSIVTCVDVDGERKCETVKVQLGPDIFEQLLGDSLVGTLHVPRLIDVAGDCVSNAVSFERQSTGVVTVTFVVSMDGA